MEDLGNGVRRHAGALPPAAQKDLARETMARAAEAGWLSPVTPGGKPFSVRQMNFGPLGWVSDRRGYRYEARHPVTGDPWPAMPSTVTALWRHYLPGALAPECCLVNWYRGDARMGLHRDADEEDQETPILTVSLGASARFRIGGPARGAPTASIVLGSGDALVMGGAARRFYHGVDHLLPDVPLLGSGPGIDGRISLTLRRVTSARCGGTGVRHVS